MEMFSNLILGFEVALSFQNLLYCFIGCFVGTAIGVVRLKPAIAKQITDWAAKLEGKGIVLVPVSAAVRSQAQG